MKKHSIKSVPFNEARIYIGSRRKYNGDAFSYADVRAYVGEFQLARGTESSNPVRITPTAYVWQDYHEPGWEIAVINYPRHPKADFVIRQFAYDLAAGLLNMFEQNRISIVFSDEIVMLEADDAEDKK